MGEGGRRGGARFAVRVAGWKSWEDLVWAQPDQVKEIDIRSLNRGQVVLSMQNSKLEQFLLIESQGGALIDMVVDLMPRRGSRRGCTDLEEQQYFDAMELLPIVTRCDSKKHFFVKYSDLNMKHAPRWEEMNPYRTVIMSILTSSKGRNVNQKTFSEAAVQFLRDHNIEVGNAEADEGVYRIRVMVSQLLNHKTKKRRVPRTWKRQYARRGVGGTVGMWCVY